MNLAMPIAILKLGELGKNLTVMICRFAFSTGVNLQLWL